MSSISYDLYIEQLDIEIELECSVVSCNDGIGSYEYWGSREYDAGENYADIDDIKWDKSKYTHQQNEIIQEEINKNWDEITYEALQKFDPF